MIIVLSSCKEEGTYPNKQISIDDFRELRESRYKLNSHSVRRHISRLMRSDSVAFAMDSKVRSYYNAGKPFIWINRLGVQARADTILSFIQNSDTLGLSPRKFRAAQIAADIRKLRTLDLVEGKDDINLLMARVEYNLTRAYFRYAAGLEYGFVNPDWLYNRLEQYTVDSATVRFRRLSDLRPLRPDGKFYSRILGIAFGDSISQYLSSLHTDGDLYRRLSGLLVRKKMNRADRIRVLCNMERCRWKYRKVARLGVEGKYVVVNIPSYSLMAGGKEGREYMRVGCGTFDHKTPLLVSRIERMEINPQWIVPKSIAMGLVGRIGYMREMGMFVHDKQFGKLPPENASYTKVAAGSQYIIQAGGPKNSLGRVIFRFDNNFSVFLHDTSSPWIFKKNMRAVSHGCVRVERPLNLALFLTSGDGDVSNRVRSLMSIDYDENPGSEEPEGQQRTYPVSYISLKESVPLYITYFTVFYNEGGNLSFFSDVYGYDEALARALSPVIL